jgi:signal-transduction protein with cAMP-binding, CBS, and nucleotidyltransferase domain
MTVNVYTIDEDTALEDVVDLMERRRIKRVPVLRGNKVVGIVTRSNLMYAIVSLARSLPKTAKDDLAIREQLIGEMQKEKWAPTAMINIGVRDRIVELWGTIFDERQRDALKVAAENIPGVRAVKDHMVWVEPVSGMFIEPREEIITH